MEVAQMSPVMPLVTVGIPTYNRASMLARSIESVLKQDYPAIEIVISDNASTDHTMQILQEYAGRHPLMKIIRQPRNLGATVNFAAVLNAASGEYFMWLGDDDWIDPSYISQCHFFLEKDSGISIAGGVPFYYRNGISAGEGGFFEAISDCWFARVYKYYARVRDNGIYYGLMRTCQLREIGVKNGMGADWHMIANMACLGRIVMIPTIFVHRELGGATSSYGNIARSLGLHTLHGAFPMTSIAIGSAENILVSGNAFRKKPIFGRVLLATAVSIRIILKSITDRISNRIRRQKW